MAVEGVLSWTAVLMRLLGTFAKTLHSCERTAKVTLRHENSLRLPHHRFVHVHILLARLPRSGPFQAMISLHPHSKVYAPSIFASVLRDLSSGLPLGPFLLVSPALPQAFAGALSLSRLLSSTEQGHCFQSNQPRRQVPLST